jgi:YVTN family beta-propeller protein
MIARALCLACALAGATPAAADGSAQLLYVTNEISGDLSIVDPDRRAVVATIALGKRPRGARLSADGTTLYVALSGSPIAGPGVDERVLPPPDKAADGIGVVDLKARRLVRVLRGVSDPEQLGIAGERLYVASEDTGTAVVLDRASGKLLATIAVGGEPEGVAVSPDGRVAYVTSEADDVVAAIDVASAKRIAEIKVGKRPRAIAFAPDGRRAYVSCENDATVHVVDVAAQKVVDVLRLDNDKLRPMGVVVSPDARRLYIATGRGGSVAVVDLGTGQVVREIAVGARPWGIALGADGRHLYTANGPSDDVSVIDTGSLRRVGTIKVGERPWDVLVGPAP